MARKKEKATPKAKQPNRVTITREDDPALYARVDARIAKSYPSTLSECRISLEWRHGVTPDSDGETLWTWTNPCPDAHRARHNFDVIIGLNFAIWNEAGPELRERMLHGALAPIDPATDHATGEQKCDVNGKPLFRLRKPDIKCFSEVEIEHPGALATTARLARRLFPLLPPPERTLMDEMEKKPKTKAEARRDTIPVHRGWQLAGPAKAGRALVEEVARAEIDRFFALVEAGNRSAATMLKRKLDAAGWVAPFGALAGEMASAASEPALAAVDRRTSSAGAES